MQMGLREIYDKLVKARRPADFFGNVSEENQKILYRAYVKKVHPDTAPDNQKYIAEQATSLLNKLNAEAMAEYREGTYAVADTMDSCGKGAPLFAFALDGKNHRFYELFFRGEVGNLYKGTNGEYAIVLKVAADPADNDLIRAEFKTLDATKHHALPIVENQLTVNGRFAITMREIEGTPLLQLRKEYPDGVPAEHVMWMLERLFSVVGYLHANRIVHGNIKPEHVIVNKKNHNVSLCGFSLCITEADKPTARYKVANEIYSPPEVNKTAQVQPGADLYAVGKLAVFLLGGDVESNAMPAIIDENIRKFVRKLVATDVKARPDDAWKLWDELIALRARLFKNERFKRLD